MSQLLADFDYYRQFIAECPSPEIVVLEVGAGYGEDTETLLAPVLATGRPFRLFSFEPEPRNVPAMRERATAPLIEIVEAAVGDRNALVDFRPSQNPQNWNQSGSVKEPVEHTKYWPYIAFLPPIKVKMVRLDDFCASRGVTHIDFIWADVQGAEDLVIAGAQQILASTRYFYTEFYEVEMYRGQLPLAEILRRLPGRWEIVRQWADNALIKNLTW
jgi:FkbM family methyltransferase